MFKIKQGYIFLVLIILSTQATALEISVAQSTQDKNLIKKPAQLNYTKPKNGDATTNADVGIGVVLIPSLMKSKANLSAIIEYHKNTDTDKEQNQRQFGLSGLYISGDGTSTNIYRSQVSIKYKNDAIKGNEIASASYNFIPAISALNIDSVYGSDYLKYVWTPSFSLEYEEVIGASDNGPKGTSLRFYPSIDIVLYPLASYFKRAVELSLSYTHWLDINETKGLDDGNSTHKLFKAGLIYYFDEKKNVGFGVDYVEGENPSEAFADQQYVQVGLRVKL